MKSSSFPVRRIVFLLCIKFVFLFKLKNLRHFEELEIRKTIQGGPLVYTEHIISLKVNRMDDETGNELKVFVVNR